MVFLKEFFEKDDLEKNQQTTKHEKYTESKELMGHFAFSLSSLPSIIFIDFLLTVKAATLIFIFGHGSAISSAKEGKSGFIYNLVKSKSAFWAAQTCVHFMKVLIVYTLNSHLLTLKAHNHKMYVFCCPLKYLKPYKQTVWTHQIRLLL